MYLDCGEESQWFADVPQRNVWLGCNGEAFFMRDGVALASELYFSEAKALTAGLRFGVSQALVDVKIWLFRKRHGCSIWRGLPDVYQACGFTMKGGSATKWVNSRLLSWGRYLESLSLTDVHLRRSKPFAATQDEVAPLQQDRVLESHTLSTMELLAVAAKYCGLLAKAGGLDDQQKPQMLAFMKAAFSLLEYTGPLDIFMDAEVNFKPPAPLLGKQHVPLHVQGGRVDVDPLLEHVAGPEHSKLQESLAVGPLLRGWARGQPLHLVDFLVETGRHKKACLS